MEKNRIWFKVLGDPSVTIYFDRFLKWNVNSLKFSIIQYIDFLISPYLIYINKCLFKIKEKN